MKKTVVITGVGGQLGQYLVLYLLKNEPDIEIIGTIRHKSYDNQVYIFDKSKVKFELMDLSDAHSIENLILKYKPDYFINTAANAFVGESWAVPLQQIDLNFTAVLHQLEAIRKHSPHTRYFNMGTSEEFACCENNGPQNEQTLISPKSPYGVAKSAARFMVDVYRKSYKIYAIQGWTYNFESKLRGPKYVTKKITQNMARIQRSMVKNENFEPLQIGFIDSFRSWQHAEDVADGVWRILNQEKFNKELKTKFDNFSSDKSHLSCLQWLSGEIKPYVLSADDTHSVREFIEKSFATIGIFGEWVGEGLNEEFIGYVNNPIYNHFKGRKYTLVQVNSSFYRPLDVTFLYGDASKAKAELGWRTTKTFADIIDEMVYADIEIYEKENKQN